MSLDPIAQPSVPWAQARSTPSTRIDPIDRNAANRLFGQQGYGLRECFLTLMDDGFAAPLQWLNSAPPPEPARLVINTWVAEQTRQRITSLIPRGGVRDDPRLVLVNARYLTVPWDSAFPVASPAPLPFHSAPRPPGTEPTLVDPSSRG